MNGVVGGFNIWELNYRKEIILFFVSVFSVLCGVMVLLVV